MTTRIRRVGLAPLFCLFLALAACGHATPEAKAPLPVSVRPAAAVEAQAARIEALANRLSAVLTPKETVNLAFKVPGYVEDLNPAALNRGDRVRAGQWLARLRDADYKARLAQARYTLEEAKATLVLARKDHERNTTLVEQGVISRSEFDRTHERLDVGQAKLEQASASLEQARINLEDTRIASPLDGVVVRRDVERGTLVNQGSVAYVLADLSSVKAVFGLPDQDLVRTATGKPVTISVESLPGREFSGLVTSVSPSADPKSRTFDVEVTIPNPDGALRDGMVATVRRNSEAAGKAAKLAAIPLQALARQAGPDSYVVFVLSQEGGRTVARERTVATAGVVGEMIAVTSGLAPGEQVITRGATLAADGQDVQVIR